MRHFRSFRGPALFLAAVVLAGAAGYRLRDFRGDSRSVLNAGVLPALEFFVQSRSFSEVENTRAELEGLALRFRSEARMRHIAARGPASPGSADDPTRAAAIAELERGIAEFKETPEEMYLVQDLLLVLRAAGQSDRWLNVYLDVLYRHPTHELVGTFAETALKVGRAAGRESEVTAGFRHLLEIPLEFPAKHTLQDAEDHATLAHQESVIPARPLL